MQQRRGDRNVKAKPLKLTKGTYMPCESSEATHLKLIFPLKFSPLKERIISVQTNGVRSGTPNWTWNGDTDKPTLRPSILTHWQAGDGNGNPEPDIVCHSFICEGVVQFLNDCTHEMAGQFIELEEV